MNTDQLERIISSQVIKSRKVKFLGVFPHDHTQFLVANTLAAHTFPICFLSNTQPSTKSGEHWVAFYYSSEHSPEFFDSYGLHPSVYEFNFTPKIYNKRCLQKLDSNVCGQYCVYFLYQRVRGKSLQEIVAPFSLDDRSWNDSQVARFISRLSR